MYLLWPIVFNLAGQLFKPAPATSTSER
jgi:hypothetical protein